MNKNDLRSFAILMATLESCFDKAVTKEKVKLYFGFLDDLSIQQVKRAVNWILKTNKYFPSISEIRTASLDSVDLKAFKAWSEVLKIGGKLSTMPEFEDPVIKVVIDQAFGGWEKFCWYSEPDEFIKGQDRKHFILAYKLFHNEMERKNLLPEMKPKELKQ